MTVKAKPDAVPVAPPQYRVVTPCVIAKGVLGSQGVFYQDSVITQWDTGAGSSDYISPAEVTRLLDDAMIRTQRTVAVVEGGILKPIVQIQGVAAGIKTALTFLMRGRPNPEDGRSSIIELTPSGKRLLAKAKLALDDELTAHLGAVLSPRALQQFAATLTKLRAGPIYLDTAMARD